MRCEEGDMRENQEDTRFKAVTVKSFTKLKYTNQENKELYRTQTK